MSKDEIKQHLNAAQIELYNLAKDNNALNELFPKLLDISFRINYEIDKNNKNQSKANITQSNHFAPSHVIPAPSHVIPAPSHVIPAPSHIDDNSSYTQIFKIDANKNEIEFFPLSAIESNDIIINNFQNLDDLKNISFASVDDLLLINKNKESMFIFASDKTQYYIDPFKKLILPNRKANAVKKWDYDVYNVKENFKTFKLVMKYIHDVMPHDNDKDFFSADNIDEFQKNSFLFNEDSNELWKIKKYKCYLGDNNKLYTIINDMIVEVDDESWYLSDK